MEVMPKSLLDNPTEAYPTLWVYLQKAENNPVKEKVLIALQQAMENMPMGNPATA